MTKFASLAAVTLAATVSMVAPTVAQAQTATGPGMAYNLYSPTAGSGTFGNNGGLSGVFTNVFTFVVTRTGVLSADFSNASTGNGLASDIDFSSGVLTGNNATINFTRLLGEPMSTIEVWGIDPTNIAAGTYTLTVSGRSFGTIATYAGNFNVSAVPEPAAWALMMIGVGAIGGALRRRQRVSVRFA